MNAVNNAWKNFRDDLSGKIREVGAAASDMSRTVGSSRAEQAARTFGAEDRRLEATVDATGKKDRGLPPQESTHHHDSEISAGSGSESVAQSWPEPRTFATGDRAHTYGTRMWGETVEGLDPAETALLRRYTESDYLMINNMLRGETPFQPSVQERVVMLDEILRKRPVPEQIQVTKAIQPWRLFPGRDMADITPGYTGKLPDFVSTAMHRDGIEVIKKLDDRNVTATIDVPAGTPGIYLGDISSRPEELELLLGRNLDFRLTQPIQRVDSGWNPRWEANIRIVPPT